MDGALTRSKSAYRKSPVPRLISPQKNKSKNIRPVPPSIPKPNLRFNRRLKERVFENITNRSPLIINLEELLQIEKTLRSTIHFQNQEDLSVANKTWWSILHENSLHHVDTIYQKAEIKKNMKGCLILGCLLFELTKFVSNREILPLQVQNYFKKMIFNYHQGFLQFVSITLERISDQNEHVEKLKEILNRENAQKTWKVNPLELLKRYNNTVKSLIVKFKRNYLYKYEDKQAREFKNVISLVAYNLQSISVKSAIEYLDMSNGCSSLIHHSQNIPSLKEFLNKPYALVIEIKHILARQELSRFIINPNAKEFLTKASVYYNIIIFTVLEQQIADPIIDKFGIKCQRFYKQHTSLIENAYAKNIESAGLDLPKTVIVDYKDMKFHPENRILIKKWDGSQHDKALIDILNILTIIAANKTSDIRAVLQNFQQQMKSQSNQGSKIYLKLS